MALPLALSGYATSSSASNSGVIHGPFKSSSGNFYLFGRSTTSTILQAQKSTDPTSSFTSVAEVTPFLLGNAVSTVFCTQNGDKIDIISGNSATAEVRYVSFDMSTDTFSSVTVISSAADAVTSSSRTGHAYRSNGDIIVGYRGARDSVMGTAYARPKYARRVSGVWTSDINLAPDTTVARNLAFVGAVLGASDSVHFFWHDVENAQLFQRTLNSSNVLQTTSTAVSYTGNSSGAAGRYSGGIGVSYTSSGATKVALVSNDNGTVKSFYFDSANTPTVNVTTIASSANTITQANVALDDGTTPKLITGYALAADGDYYVQTSTDHGATWSSATKVETTTIANDAISLCYTGPVYLRGSNYVYGFVYLDSTSTATYYYDEYVVRSASSPSFPPYIPTYSFQHMIVR